jgi:hypothetical protein
MTTTRNVWVRGALAAGLLLGAGALPGVGEETGGKPGLRPWSEYRVVLWIGDSVWKHPDRFPVFLRRMREMGVDTGMVHHTGDPAPWVKAGVPYYVENIVNRGLCLKWNSRVRDWDGFVTRWAKSGRPEAMFRRGYCLDDPEWLGWARDEVRSIATRHRDHAPLAYDLRDELSVTMSANPFDYDFNPAAQEGFRRWLRKNYRSLDALNRQWGTQFKAWRDVAPIGTDRIKRRMVTGEAWPQGQPDWHAVQRLRYSPAEARKHPERWNLSPWCDFRSYMDVSLARTLDELRRVSHAADPRTPVGIEGTQMPAAFGGYDLWRISRALDWVEPYDIGNAREIFGAFMPGKPILCTVFEKETRPATRRLWHLLLEGDRGCIVWWSEDCFDWKNPELPLTAKARALAPVFRELRSPLARLFLRAERLKDPVAIVYSQPSIQVDWLMESTRDGNTWPRRFSSYEASHNRMAAVRNAWLRALQDFGASPQFVPAHRLTDPKAMAKFRVLVLPTLRTMSDGQIEGVARFLKNPKNADRLVLSDGTPGDFDEHGRLRKTNPLAAKWTGVHESAEAVVFVSGDGPGKPPVSHRHPGDIAEYARERLSGSGDPAKLLWTRCLGDAMRSAYRPPVQVDPSLRVRIYRYRLGDAGLLAFERSIDYQMSESLRQAGGNEALEHPADVVARLRRPGHVYDLRAKRYLGRASEIRFRLDPWRPSLFAVLPEPVGEGRDVVDALSAAIP